MRHPFEMMASVGADMAITMAVAFCGMGSLVGLVALWLLVNKKYRESAISGLMALMMLFASQRAYESYHKLMVAADGVGSSDFYAFAGMCALGSLGFLPILFVFFYKPAP